jgi:recombination protein RecA
MDNTVGRLSDEERAVIIGSLLGDGYMRIVPGRRDAFLEINHSAKAREYVDWKYAILKNICTSPPHVRATNGDRQAYRFFTQQHGELTQLYALWYVQKKKVIPKDITLNPLILAVWYMDDGSKSRDSDVYLNTQQFSMNDQRRLLHLLRTLGINARLNKDKQYHRIRILKESLPRFMQLVAPYVPPSMQYKLITQNP